MTVSQDTTPPGVTLSIARRASLLDLWWPPLATMPELWTTTNLADGPWWQWPEPLVTNFLTITNAPGQKFFRLKAP